MAEKEYIEREAAIENICGRLKLTNPGGIEYSNTDVRTFVAALISPIPAADVRPVKKGRWIRHYEQADMGEDIITYPCGWVCSECGRWESDDEPFCNCGADMRGEQYV